MVNKSVRIAVLLSALISPTIYGASIAWDCFEYVSDVDYVIIDEDLNTSPITAHCIQPIDNGDWKPYGYLFFDVKFRGLMVTLTSYKNYLCGDPIAWAQVSYGDEISKETMLRRGDDYFVYSLDMDPMLGFGDKTISFDRRDTIYLALVDNINIPENESLISSYLFGWVELGVENNSLKVLNSAFGLEPGLGLSAGGGAIPEPSTILLYAIGIAAIGLKRRLV